MTLGNAFISGVHQVALVVRDIDKALEEYTNRMGIGPWWVRLYAPPQLTDMRIRGEKIPYSLLAPASVVAETLVWLESDGLALLTTSSRPFARTCPIAAVA